MKLLSSGDRSASLHRRTEMTLCHPLPTESDELAGLEHELELCRASIEHLSCKLAERLAEERSSNQQNATNNIGHPKVSARDDDQTDRNIREFMTNAPSQLVASSAESEGERRLSEYSRHRKTNRKMSTSHSDRDRMSNVGSKTSCQYSACCDAEDDD